MEYFDLPDSVVPESNGQRAIRRIKESDARDVNFRTHSETIRDATHILMRNERNNGREDVIAAIRGVWRWHLYRNDLDAEDFIQSVKLYLKKRENNESI